MVRKPDPWLLHDAAWRHPAQIVTQWQGANRVESRLLRYRTSGSWWETLAASGITLLVTREYEHLVMGLRATPAGPEVTYLPLPHPSGLVVDRPRRRVWVASTRNPNQLFALQPVIGLHARSDSPAELSGHPLVPVASLLYPGCLYIHDLALIGGVLHANAVGQNAVVRLPEDGSHPIVWWPRAIERNGRPMLDRNHIQLNSIAAGPTIAKSYFSASTDAISERRPGHKNFPVDGRGVIFSGRSREAIVRGLTRPHSARLHRNRLWVDNSGYGEVGIVEEGRFRAIARLPGWTRGLCFHRDIAFVATSRVIPAFRCYAPGLKMHRSLCGVHAISAKTGRILGSLIFPQGNQIFAVDWMLECSGFPFSAGPRHPLETRGLFYSFMTRKGL